MQKQLCAIVLVLSGGLLAAPLAPTSYSMRNGDGQASGGSFNYWDREYTGSGATTGDASPLSGGLGNLTDGVIAADNWLNVESAAGTGPYVGWRSVNGLPVITFQFAGFNAFSTMTLHLDDSDGVGGVDLPSSADVKIGTTTLNFPIFPQAGSAPKAIALSLGGLSGNQVELTLNYANDWVFMSEVQFDGRPAEIPEPASAALCAGGLLAAVAWRRWRRA